jgi:uncharacterized protein
MSRRRVAFLLLGVGVVLLFGGRWMAIRYTEASWFADLGLSRLFWARLRHDLLWQLAVAVVATLWYAAQTMAVYRSIGAVHLPRRVGNLEIAEEIPRRNLRWLAILVAVILGMVTAATFADLPDLVSLYRAAIPLHLQEPIFGRDASFYLARLPLLETLHLGALLLVLFGIFVAGALYAMTGSITVSERRLRMTVHARTHLVALLTALALVIAWGFRLDAIGIVGGGGSAGGALGAVDRAIRIPAALALEALALVLAAATAATLWRGRALLLVAIWSTLAAAVVLGRFVVPYLADVWGARPNRAEAAALAQYADRYSRAGLGVLGSVPEERLDAVNELTGDSLAALNAALRGLSPWDGESALLAAALGAALPDSTRPRVWSTTLDPYRGSGGEPVLVALAVPQTDELTLDRGPQPPDWTAQHRGPLSWAGNPVALLAGAGAGDGLRFLTALDSAGDTSAIPVTLQPAAGPVRYLGHGAGLAIVGPSAPPPPVGPAGMRLGGLARRLLLAWALQSPPLLGRRTSVADRVLVWRDVPRRLARLYPFATFTAPRPVIVAGRLLWLADGYLASARFPLADHVHWDDDDVNYLRAAYLATVDAVSGTTRLYLRPPDEPFAASLAAAMASPALPGESLSVALRRHLDYPASLLLAQAQMLARYRGDTGAAAAPWAPALPAADSEHESPAQPHATVALLSLDGAASLWRLLPLVDGSGRALVAFAAATERPDGTPELRLLRLKSETFPTLAVAQSRISLSPAVVGAMARASGPDGAVRRGPLAIVPAAGTVAYVQFLFAAPRRGDALLPAGAAVLAGGQVGVGDDLAAAVRGVLAAGGGAPAEATTAASLAEARRAFLSLDSAVRHGDWGRFGHAYETLRKALGVDGRGTRRP